jgi:putative ABC transport system permease protein
MSDLVRDARFGCRLLWRNPGFTSIAVLALALGIAANTAIFSVVYATLLAPLPYPHPDQLVMVWSKIQGNKNVTAAATYQEWKRQSKVFQDLNAWTGRGVSFATGSDRPERVQASVMTPGFYKMVGDPLFMGRDFLPEEGEPGKDRVTILSHRFWRERFGSDANILGREVRIDGQPHTIVGVLAPGLADRGDGRLSVPLAFNPDQLNHDFHWLLVMGRLKANVSMEQANSDMDVVTKQLAEAFPKSNTGWSAVVEPLQNNFLSRETIRGLWLLLGAVGFVLLIACANVANLLLARGTARQREVAVRSSLGAGRRQLFAQFLTEGVLLAGIGGVVGVLLASILLSVILAMMPPNTLPIEAEVGLNMPVLLFTLAASVLSGVLFGCAPAWQATRANLNTTLKEEGRSTVGGGRHRLRRGLVVAEFALALTLLAGGGLAIHSLVKLIHVDLGFRTDHLLTFSLPVPSERLSQPEQISAFYRRLLEQVEAVPGVASASTSTGMPVMGTGFGMPFDVAGKPAADPSQRPGAGFNMVTPGYFRTFGLQMVRGRALTEADVAGGLPAAVVNETFVKRYLAGVDPLAQRLMVEQLIPGVTKLGPPVEWQIVGVYRDIRNAGPRGTREGDSFPEIDVPFWQSPWPGTVMAVRTAGDPGSIRKSIAAIVQSMDPDLPIADVKTMDQLVDESMAGDRFNALLFGTFAGLALVLAVLGIYGVMSFAVAQRTHEIGLRMALGADRGRVLKEVLKEGLATALAGLVLGSIGAYFVGRAMQGMWFGVGAMEPGSFSLVAATLLAAALLACIVPARRAASVDPMTALRQE